MGGPFSWVIFVTVDRKITPKYTGFLSCETLSFIKMNHTINIAQRKPIWIALSEFYLDTELQESDFRRIAFKIIESPYPMDEVKEINKYEVFPVLQPNLLSVAGVWAGFDENWLVNCITDSLAQRTAIKKLGIESSFIIFRWMQKDYWEKLEKAYNQLKNNPEHSS